MMTLAERRSEYEANLHLANRPKGPTAGPKWAAGAKAEHDEDQPHHIYLVHSGKRKVIAGPFKNKAEAEAHPWRKRADGVAPSHLIEHDQQLEQEMEQMIKEAEEAGFEVTQLDEMMGYVKHNGESIATNGSYHMVGMKKNDKGFWDHDSSAVFDKIEDAKAFIDGGKKGEHTTIAQSAAKRKAGVQESFVGAVASKDFNAAEAAFKQMMAEKLAAALDSRKIEIAQSLYQRATDAKG